MGKRLYKGRGSERGGKKIEIGKMMMKPRMKKMRVEAKTEGEIGCLASDVLCDVLSRLPVKSLSRFKCVSKGWLNLIKGDTFVQLHLTRSKQNGTGRFVRICTRRCNDYHVPKARFYKLDDKQEDASPKLVGEVVSFRFPTLPPSCNGLVCYMSRAYRIQVCNPITRQTITLPRPRFLFPKRVRKLKRVILGIGYVSADNKYKVVAAWSTRTGSSGVEIFTLGGGGSWRPVSSKFKYKSLLNDSLSQYSAPAYANGSLYWYMDESFSNEYGDSFDRYPRHITAFDFALEKFNLIPVPDDVDRMNHVCWISELRGHLCFLERPEHGPTVKMWMLMNNNNNHHEWVTQNIPSNLFWVGTISINQNDYMSMVRQGKDQLTLHSGLYHFQGHLIKPTELLPCLRKYDFEVAQFHQESLVTFY